MNNLTAAILTLVIISPSIIVLAVIVYRQVREFWIWTEPVRARKRALARRPTSYGIPLRRYLMLSGKVLPEPRFPSDDHLKVIEHLVGIWNPPFGVRHVVIANTLHVRGLRIVRQHLPYKLAGRLRVINKWPANNPAEDQCTS